MLDQMLLPFRGHKLWINARKYTIVDWVGEVPLSNARFDFN